MSQALLDCGKRAELPSTSGASFADAAGGNSQATTGTGVSAKKLEEETEDFSSTILFLCCHGGLATVDVMSQFLTSACYMEQLGLLLMLFHQAFNSSTWNVVLRMQTTQRN